MSFFNGSEAKSLHPLVQTIPYLCDVVCYLRTGLENSAQKVLAASEEQTVRTTLFGNGWPNAYHRTLRTPFVEEWLPEEQRGSEERSDEPVIGEVTLGGARMPLRRFGGIPPARDATGEIDSMDFLAGQCVGLVREIKPAGEIIREVVEEAARVMMFVTWQDHRWLSYCPSEVASAL